MKKVIFIYLLSLSMCLSAPTDADAPALQANTPKANPGTDPKVTPTEVADNKTHVIEPETTHPVSLTPSTDSQKNLEPNNAQTDKTPNGTKPNVDTTTVNDAAKNKTIEAKPELSKNDTNKPKIDSVTVVNDATKSEDNSANKNQTTTEAIKTSEGTKPATPIKPTETPKPSEAPKTTEVPKPDTDKHTTNVQARGFDGPSFIGGIILTLGLLAIGFMGFKYYKNQTERNYHTL